MLFDQKSQALVCAVRSTNTIKILFIVTCHLLQCNFSHVTYINGHNIVTLPLLTPDNS